MTLGSRVRELRLSEGMSQRMFGDVAGLTGVTICDLEKDRRGARAKTIVAICERFNVSADYLLFGKTK